MGRPVGADSGGAGPGPGAGAAGDRGRGGRARAGLGGGGSALVAEGLAAAGVRGIDHGLGRGLGDRGPVRATELGGAAARGGAGHELEPPLADADTRVGITVGIPAGEAGRRHGLRVGTAPDDDGVLGRAPGTWRERAGLAVRERMPLWVQSRCGLERRSVAALTVLLVVAAVFAVQHFWAGRTQPVRAPEVVRTSTPYGGQGERAAAGPGPSGDTSVSAGATGAAIVVDVSGKVRNPGIQRLPAGSRVADALRAAGGVRPGTSTEGLNRARLLVDGEQVVVGGPAPAAGPGVAGSSGSAGSAAGAAPAAPVSLNSATPDQLDALPGVGPVLAQRILDYRTQHGGFRSVDELREVNGIGDRRFADLRNLVRP
ncbi:helix-hairpin-helix domain-containing protein [Streptomyces sp. NPDC058371]|uniref:helix-hairpin-helix domain-containing protein n=1 Tax=Streptomyces sp. NPDC058371 TaxID=3346463 RepID=UPI003659E48C